MDKNLWLNFLTHPVYVFEGILIMFLLIWLITTSFIMRLL